MQTKEIKAKIKSVSNIKKITKTMEMVSVSKMRKTTERALASQAYARHALELLVHLTGEHEVDHSFLTTGAGDTTLILIIGSNKGLCGGYNMNINKRIRNFVGSHDGNFAAITIGKQAERIARRNSVDVVASFTEFGDLVTTEEVYSIVRVITEQFETGNFSRVVVAFTNYVKMLDYRPTMRQLLPITAQSLEDMSAVLLDGEDTSWKKENLSLYSFEPSMQEVLEQVVPNLLVSVIYQALLESAAAEHSSRMVAMKGATDNAGNLLEDLRLSYNKARQEAITREISEIAAGGEATG